MIKSYRDLEVYIESYSLMLIVHKEVIGFPSYEKIDLVSQMRRASKSIPSNIAEGWAKRQYEKEFKKHLIISVGSANEMENHIQTANDLGYWQKDLSNDLFKRYHFLGGKLMNLLKNWRS